MSWVIPFAESKNGGGNLQPEMTSEESPDADRNDLARRLEPVAAKLLSVMDIPSDLLASFIAFYHQYIGSGGDVRRLSNLDLHMAAVQPSTLGKRRKSSLRRLSSVSVPEQVEMTAIGGALQFDFGTFVTQMREEFWENNEDSTKALARRQQPRHRHLKPWSSGPWNRVLKEIEGRYGAEVMSYFSFLQHTMLGNAAVLLLMLLVIVPHFALLREEPASSSRNSTAVEICSANYTDSVRARINRSEWIDYPVYLFTGTGILEEILFYGMLKPYYTMRILGRNVNFNMSLTMVIIPFLSLLVCLVLIMARASSYLSSSIRDSKQVQSSKYTVQILSSWKHNVTEPKACVLQNHLIRNKLLNMLSKDARHAKSRARNFLRTVMLIFFRIIASILAIVLLAVCGLLVFLAQQFSEERLASLVNAEPNGAMELALSFLTPFTITALNLLAGLLFDLIVKLESYSREVTVTVTIVRAAALRVASLVLLFANFFAKSWTCKASPSMDKPNDSTVLIDAASNDAATRVCGNCLATEGEQAYCWESYVGQQLYKLVIVDFLMVLVSVFLIETPWRLIYERFKDKSFIVQRIGLPELDIPKLVLDVAYTQTLCWVSTLFCPFIPAMTFATTLVLFYSKKYSIQRNFKLEREFSSSSEVRVVFLLLLCPFLILSLAILVVCVVFLTQSQGCGPFRELPDKYHMINAISEALAGYPAAADVFKIITDVKFLIVVIVILSIAIYYKKAVAHGTDRLVELLEESKGRMIKDNKSLWAKIHVKTRQLVESDERRLPPPRSTASHALRDSEAKLRRSDYTGSGSPRSSSLRYAATNTAGAPHPDDTARAEDGDRAAFAVGHGTPHLLSGGSSHFTPATSNGGFDGPPSSCNDGLQETSENI